MDNPMRNIDNNLRILYPEYYNDGASNDPEGTVNVIRCGHFSYY